MPDESGIHCHQQQGVVTLTCGGEAFARLWAAVGGAAPTAAGLPGAVEVVVIRRAAPDPRPRPWLDALGYLGCATAALVVLLLLGAGAYTVSSWVW